MIRNDLDLSSLGNCGIPTKLDVYWMIIFEVSTRDTVSVLPMSLHGSSPQHGRVHTDCPEAVAVAKALAGIASCWTSISLQRSQKQNAELSMNDGPTSNCPPIDLAIPLESQSQRRWHHQCSTDHPWPDHLASVSADGIISGVSSPWADTANWLMPAGETGAGVW